MLPFNYIKIQNTECLMRRAFYDVNAKARWKK